MAKLSTNLNEFQMIPKNPIKKKESGRITKNQNKEAECKNKTTALISQPRTIGTDNIGGAAEVWVTREGTSRPTRCGRRPKFIFHTPDPHI